MRAPTPGLSSGSPAPEQAKVLREGKRATGKKSQKRQKLEALDDDELLLMALQDTQANSDPPPHATHSPYSQALSQDTLETRALQAELDLAAAADRYNVGKRDSPRHTAPLPQRNAADVEGLLLTVTNEAGRRVYCHVADSAELPRGRAPPPAGALLSKPIDLMMLQVVSLAFSTTQCLQQSFGALKFRASLF